VQLTDEIRRYIEKMTLILELDGMPRTAGRVLSYLLICKPVEQSMHDLIDALGMSKSSISTSTQTLIQFGMIERVSLPGQRRDHYRITPNVWNTIMHKRVMMTKRLKGIAEEGLELVGNVSCSGNCKNLEEMYEFFEFWEQEMPLLLDRWNEKKQESIDQTLDILQ
jgi:DNA-binding transcriptional regulator GbsR (MarR family)